MGQHSLGISQPQRVKAVSGLNQTLLKASAGLVCGWYLFNNSGGALFVKFYDKATTPTAGTDAILFTVALPSGGGSNIDWPDGIKFANGIGYAITGAIADDDTTTVSDDDVHGVILTQ